MKELLGFFINQVFVGVFQHDSGTPKHALELWKEYVLKALIKGGGETSGD